MNKTLEERFITFTKGLDGAELIDEIALTPEQQAAQKADLFFNDRNIVGELKSLKTNTESKVETILEPYKNTPEWPHFYGTQEVHKVLNHLPDKDKLQARIFGAVTDSIEGVIEKANRQIRTTKKTFNLPTAGGLLIILNDLVDVISPNVLADRVHKCLRKRTATGEIRYPEITLVWAINGAHYAQITPTLKAMPILIMPSGQPDIHNIEGFVKSLGRKWSEHEGVPYLKTDAATFKKAEFRKFSDDAKKNKPITRQESWSLQYKENPYLRSLSKEELLEHGQKVISLSGRTFSNKAKRKPTKESMSKVGAQFTHFIDEMNYRGIDMREFAPKVQGLNERFHIAIKEKKKQLKAHKNKIGRGAPCPCQSGKTYQRCCGKKAITK
jgi:hypothetical protein